MALNIPASPTTLTAISKSGFGDATRDSLLWLATDAPCCRVYNSATQSISTSSATALTFNSERYDTGGCHSTSVNTGRITVPSGAGGKWEFGASVEFDSNATGYRYAGLRVNGSTFIVYDTKTALNGNSTVLNPCADYAMSAADYVEVVVFQSSGGNLNVLANSAYSAEFWGKWVRT